MQKYIPIVLLIMLGVICRFLPHPANFAPIGAIALFGAIYLPTRWSLLITLPAMFISDLFIGFYNWPIMLAVYTAFVLIAVIGSYIKKNKKFHTILGGALLGSILFFLITNWAVWAFGSMYTHNFYGLLQSYYMAVPFFRNSLLGDLFYTFVLIGGLELLYFIKSSKLLLQTVDEKNNY